MQNVKPDGKNKYFMSIRMHLNFTCWLDGLGKQKQIDATWKWLDLLDLKIGKRAKKKKRNDICYVFISNFMRAHVFRFWMTGFMLGYVIVTLVVVAVCCGAVCYYHFFLSFFIISLNRYDSDWTLWFLNNFFCFVSAVVFFCFFYFFFPVVHFHLHCCLPFEPLKRNKFSVELQHYLQAPFTVKSHCNPKRLTQISSLIHGSYDG